MKKEIDVAALNQAFREAYAPEAKRFKAEGATLTDEDRGDMRAVGFAMPDIEGAVDTFCDAWPMAKKFANMALQFFGWWNPAAAAALRAAIKAIDAQVVPVVCGPSE